MTLDQAKAWAAQIAKDASPGPKGVPKLSKEQARAMVATLGACLAASDPVTGALDSQFAARLNAGRLSAEFSRDAKSVSFAQAVLAIGNNDSLSAALRAGAQNVADGNGSPLDPKTQSEIAEVAAAFDAIVHGAALANKKT